ncbi:DUF1684 domain-containing protein [bacterium]|nr:DUF1684 domain-containing protein [bacterium]
MPDSKFARFVLSVFALLLLLSCTTEQTPTPNYAYVTEIQKWHKDRMAELKSEDGWLNLAGLYWLKEGKNTFGGDPANDCVFPFEKAPKFMGAYWLKDDQVEVQINPGISVLHQGNQVTKMKLAVNHDEQSIDELTHGSMKWFVIGRDGQIGVRLRDLDSPNVAHFQGVATYPINPVWRVEATFVANDPPKAIRVGTVFGTTREHASPGTLIFNAHGDSYSLDVLSRNKQDELFVVLADKTTGVETYSGGRFLYVLPPDENGRVFIDFNKAYNPPCAFSAFSTCPLPPEQNRLPIRITAGEKKYAYESDSPS